MAETEQAGFIESSWVNEVKHLIEVTEEEKEQEEERCQMKKS